MNFTQYTHPNPYSLSNEPYTGHRALFKDVCGVALGSGRTPLTAICESKLREAWDLLLRIDQAALGIWKVSYNPHGGTATANRHVLLTVDLNHRVLLKTKMIKDRRELVDIRRNRSTILLKLGCPECARTFAEMAHFKLEPITGGEEYVPGNYTYTIEWAVPPKTTKKRR